MLNIKEKLMNSEGLIGIWGTGYIGFSSMAYFASNGIKCIGIDIDERKIKRINEGKFPEPNMEYWLGFGTSQLIEDGIIRATTDWKELMQHQVLVHLICIPTEKNAMPYDEVLKDVIKKIASFKHLKSKDTPLVIIESTLTPGRTDEIIIPIFQKAGLRVGQDILVGVAPRRDWFISPEKNLKSLPRVAGGTTPETTKIMLEFLSIVCDKVLPARDHRHAEIVKSIENAYRHVEITLANQLSLAYPDIDMKEVLELVGTKWNIGTYRPSFGTGGYCIPLSSQYVLAGAQKADFLSILSETIKTDRNLPQLVAQSLIDRGAKKVGILGLSYKGDLKVHILSPTIKIVEFLKSKKIEVKVHDPYYSKQEIMNILGVGTFDYPSELNLFDTILIVSDHREYQFTPRKVLLDNLRNCKLILNNTGIWNDVDFKKAGIVHHIAGNPQWLSDSSI